MMPLKKNLKVLFTKYLLRSCQTALRTKNDKTFTMCDIAPLFMHTRQRLERLSDHLIGQLLDQHSKPIVNAYFMWWGGWVVSEGRGRGVVEMWAGRGRQMEL